MLTRIQYTTTPGPEEFYMSWFCTLPIELMAARELLDEEYRGVTDFKEDFSACLTGRIGRHNVVLAILPEKTYELSSDASIAASLIGIFPNIRYRLMLDTVSKVSTDAHDIRLGDVIVSRSNSDLMEQHGHQTCFLCSRLTYPTSERPAKPEYFLDDCDTSINKPSNDYEPHFFDFHQEYKNSIFIEKKLGKKCNQRSPGEELDPYIHYGLAMPSREYSNDMDIRNEMEKQDNVLCFEMEAAGLMKNIPCLVVRGICDYADSHKTTAWRAYASQAAAALAKELLTNISASVLGQEQPPEAISQTLDSSIKTSMQKRQNDKQSEHKEEDLHYNRETIQASVEVATKPVEENNIDICPKKKRNWVRGYVSLATQPLAVCRTQSLSDIQKLMVALAAQAIWAFLWYNFDLEKCKIEYDVAPPTQTSQLFTVMKIKPGNCNYTFLGLLILTLIYWVAQCSLIWPSKNEQHRLLYAFWAVAVTITGGLLLCDDIAVWVVFVLPTALSLSMAVCLMRESAAERSKLTAVV